MGGRSPRKGGNVYVRLLARTILNPYEVWMVPAEVSGRKLTVLRTLRLFADKEGHLEGFAVWNLVGGKLWQGDIFLAQKLENSARASEFYLENHRVVSIIYKDL